jgi:hypothetical protein
VGAFTVEQTPSQERVRDLLRRAWRSRVTMTAFYLATLIGLLAVTGAGPDTFSSRPASDPITEAARLARLSVAAEQD